MRSIFLAIALVCVSGCGLTLPPIEIVLDRPVVVPSTPVLAPELTEEPPVAVAPEPEVEAPVAQPPLQNLDIVVEDANTGAGIAGARCELDGDVRVSDGSGFINFAVRGTVMVLCLAEGYQGRHPVELSAGDQRIPLARIEAPKPKPGEPSNLGFAGCGAAENTLRISNGCLAAVAQASRNYGACEDGDPVACHRYTREVALALRTTQQDAGWGLLSKPVGQQSCSLTECGGHVGGYGEDIVTYLPRGHGVGKWTGLDIVVGAGAAGAHYAGGDLPPAVGGRADNLWAPIPTPQ